MDSSTEDPAVASIDPESDRYLDVGQMKVFEVNEHRVAVVRTDDGVYALDNACPHQGYGLVTGELGVDGNADAVVTCQWHNWKFRVRDGVCTIGEEDVASHAVDVDDKGDVRVTINRRTSAEQLETLWPSLRAGLANHYVGQIARDSVRLLDNGATPAEVMAAALLSTVDQTDDGVGHEVALAADCLGLANQYEGDDRVLPLVTGLSGLAEVTRDRESLSVGPEQGGDLVELIETEQMKAAMATVQTMPLGEARSAVVEAASRHHLGYGHGVIYTQKVFELIDRAGPEIAAPVLAQLVRSLTLMTREDTLPYMRATVRTIDETDLVALARAERTAGPVTPEMVAQFLEADEAPVAAAVAAAHDGLGVEGLIDIAALGSARRMLRYDPSLEERPDMTFGWLDITHGLTHARAARWAWEHEPGPHAARIALHAIWLLFDTGRQERRQGTENAPSDPPSAGGDANVDQDDPIAVATALLSQAMNDEAGSFIVVAHLVKTAVAALEETQATGSMLPLQATARLLQAQRRERFVARAVDESVRFVRTGRPPLR